jgi:hypothetical protein
MMQEARKQVPKAHVPGWKGANPNFQLPPQLPYRPPLPSIVISPELTLPPQDVSSELSPSFVPIAQPEPLPRPPDQSDESVQEEMKEEAKSPKSYPPNAKHFPDADIQKLDEKDKEEASFLPLMPFAEDFTVSSKLEAMSERLKTLQSKLREVRSTQLQQQLAIDRLEGAQTNTTEVLLREILQILRS